MRPFSLLFSAANQAAGPSPAFGRSLTANVDTRPRKDGIPNVSDLKSFAMEFVQARLNSPANIKPVAHAQQVEPIAILTRLELLSS